MFFNTINAGGHLLLDYWADSEKQDYIILKLFQTNPAEFTPFEIQQKLCLIGRDYPITSIRRSITVLTNKGLLKKLDKQKPGIYGKSNYTWKLA